MNENNITKVTEQVTKIQFYVQKYNAEDDNYYFDSSAAGETTVSKLIESIKNPKPDLKKLIDEIRIEKDESKRSKMKSSLPGFIIQSYGTGIRRNYVNLKSFTGFTVLDFDGEIVKAHAQGLKQFLFENYDFIVASYISPSGKVKCIMKVGIAASVEEYQEYYRSITKHFSNYDGFDPTPKNAVLIMFYTYDPDILIRTDATVWTDKLAEEPTPVIEFQKFVSNATNSGYLYKYRTERAYNLIKGRISNISDVGHSFVISAAVDLGGYIGYYDLDYRDAQAFFFNQIDNHSYLSKKSSTYKKTATRYLKEGIFNPIQFPEL